MARISHLSICKHPWFFFKSMSWGYNTDSIEDLHENVWEKMLFFGLLHVKFHIHKYRGDKASLSCVDVTCMVPAGIGGVII